MNIMDHPPLAELLAALPLRFFALNSFITHKYFQNLMPYNYGNIFLYQNTVAAEKMLNTSRYFLFFIWSTLFLAAFWLFGYFAGGEAMSLACVLLFLSNPVFISNLPLVTTDAAPSFFYFLACLLGFLLSSGKKTGFRALDSKYSLAAIAGIVSGLAMASKYSMFILPPLFSLMLIGSNFFTGRFKTGEMVRIIFVYMAVSVIALLAVYKGDAALYSDALLETFKRLEKGRPSFIMGRRLVGGVWWYFPAAFALKTPVFTLLMFIAGIFFMFRDYRRFIWILAPFLFYFAAAMNSRVQIGVRHILPTMPFALLIAAYGVKKIYENFHSRSLYILVPVFLLSFYGVFRTGSFQLSYFNELAGGPENGWKYLTDSNTDWGQDMKALSLWLKEHGNPPVVLAYFGVANPSYYGLNYVPLGLVSNVNFEYKKSDICSSNKVLIAISITNLQGTYYEDKNTFSWLKERKPIHKAGYSIFLYDLTDDKQGIRKLSELFSGAGELAYAHCFEKRAANLK